MQKQIRKRLLCMILGITAALGIGLAAGAIMAEPVSAADTVADEKWVNYTDNKDGTCTITKFNYIAGTSPTEIIIPKEIKGLKVREIGNDAFSGCGLTKLTFESGSKLYKIGDRAFKGSSISSLSLPNTVSILGKSCFENNANLTSLDLSNCTALDEIPDAAFAFGASLRSLKLPSALESIGKEAFYGCKISGTVVIPGTVKSIGYRALSGIRSGGCTYDLTKHEPGSLEGHPWSATQATFKWSDKNQDKKTNTVLLFDKEQGLIYGMKADAATKSYADWNHTTGTLTIPSSIGGVHVNGLMDGVFATDPAKITVKVVRFGTGHTFDTLPIFAFSSMSTTQTSGLEVYLPESVKTIGERAFDFTNLTKITMPGVTKVDSMAFYQTRMLQNVTFDSNNVQSIAGDAFTNSVVTEINLKQMNKGTVSGAPWSAVLAQVNWKNGTTASSNIVDSTNTWLYDPTTNVVFRYLGPDGDDVDLVVPAQLTSKNGVRTNITGIASSMMIDESKRFKSLTISEGITYIGTRAFRNNTIPEINLPESLRTIQFEAFQYTGADFSKTKLPDKLTLIGNNAFSDCTFSDRVIIPGNVTEVSNMAFYGTKGITSFQVKQYRSAPSDGVYDDANGKYLHSEAMVQGNAPFGVSRAPVYYMDDPRPTPKYTTQLDAAANKVIVKVQGYTNNDFYIVKNMTSASGQPGLTGAAYPTANGKENPATADLVISSKTANNIRGGNGDYNLAYVYGNQGDETDRKNYTDKVTVNAFHTITYNANAGGKAVSGAVPTQGDSYVNGAKATVKGKNTLAIEGYTFKGWNSKADGTGTTFQENAQLTMGTVNVPLYAKWEINKPTVTLNGNGGTLSGAPTKNVTGNYGTQITGASGYVEPSKTGSSFIGWATTNNATSPNVTTMPANNATYYAVWKVGSVAVTLDANGGTVNGSATDVIAGNVGATMSLPTASAMKRDGYNFNGWFTEKTGGQKVTDTTFPPSNDIYYAQWGAKDNKVKFAAATGGKANTGEKTVKSGNKVGVTPAATADGGYTFTGYWNCSEGGTFSSAEVNNYVISGKNATVTFTAQFTVNGNSTIIYDCQGGVTDQGESLRVYSQPAGKAFTEELPVPKKVGYSYQWDKDRPSVYPAAGQVIIVDAVWTPNKIKVVFTVNGAGGIVNPQEVVVDAGTCVGIKPTLTSQNTSTMKYTPTNIWDISDGGQITTDGIANYLISGESDTVTFTTSFKGEKIDMTNPNDKTEGEVDNIIKNSKSEEIKGATFSMLQAKGVAKGKKKVKLTWKRVPGATKYVIYGNACGKSKKYQRFKVTKGKSLTVAKINRIKLKKGKYYKFVIIAFNKEGKSISVSKTIHVATNGGKKGNPKAVKYSKPKKSSLSIKKGRTYKAKAKHVKGKKRFSQHRKVAFESSNPKIATVTKAGKITAKQKGKCYIYAYGQNGVFKRIKLTVK